MLNKILKLSILTLIALSTTLPCLAEDELLLIAQDNERIVKRINKKLIRNDNAYFGACYDVCCTISGCPTPTQELSCAHSCQ